MSRKANVGMRHSRTAALFTPEALVFLALVWNPWPLASYRRALASDRGVKPCSTRPTVIVSKKKTHGRFGVTAYEMPVEDSFCVVSGTVHGLLVFYYSILDGTCTTL